MLVAHKINHSRPMPSFTFFYIGGDVNRCIRNDGVRHSFYSTMYKCMYMYIYIYTDNATNIVKSDSTAIFDAQAAAAACSLVTPFFTATAARAALNSALALGVEPQNDCELLSCQ